jgi:hypothetical protein
MDVKLAAPPEILQDKAKIGEFVGKLLADFESVAGKLLRAKSVDSNLIIDCQQGLKSLNQYFKEASGDAPPTVGAVKAIFAGLNKLCTSAHTEEMSALQSLPILPAIKFKDLGGIKRYEVISHSDPAQQSIAQETLEDFDALNFAGEVIRHALKGGSYGLVDDVYTGVYGSVELEKSIISYLMKR